MFEVVLFCRSFKSHAETIFMETRSEITPLKRLLFERQMSVRQLHEKTAIVYGTLREIVNGRVPGMENGIRIARALKVTVEDLWGHLVDEDESS